VGELVDRLVHDVRAEPGNVVFEAWVRTQQPEEYVVFETYRDRAAFEEHICTPHSVEFNRLLGPLVVGGGSRLTWLSPVSE
jgi:quinol monooxygenase YgiN